MSKYNLQQIADRVSMHGYVLSTEGSELTHEDLATIASDFEELVLSLREKANDLA